MNYPFRNCLVTVQAENDNGEVHFRLKNMDGEVELLLKPLWIVDVYATSDHYKKYSKGDYFQHTFKSNPAKVGLGALLHDFLLENKNKFQFPFENVYSTHPIQDGYMISVAAHTFWEKRASQSNAIYDEDVDRMKIVWNKTSQSLE